MMILVIGWHTPSDVIRRPAGVCCGSCLFVVVLFVSSLVFVSTFPLARIFAPSNLNPPPPPFPHPPPLPPPSPLPPSSSASCFSSIVLTFVSKHDSVSTQTPAYAKPIFCVSSSCFSSASFVAMCWARLCPRLAQHARVLFCSNVHCGAHDWFALSFLPFYVPLPHTGGLSIHLLLCRTPFTRITFLCMAFFKHLGSHTVSV